MRVCSRRTGGVAAAAAAKSARMRALYCVPHRPDRRPMRPDRVT